MLIKYIRLINFKRLPLRDVEIFEHNFTSKLLMITGANGSGKTSLFNELTPLPADKTNFNKNGYKEIHIEKEGNLFKLISDFTNGSSYSFLINDKEYNLSNNVTAQRELVFMYFNINQVIHELIIGTETFTEMSLASRKKLFNLITHINIDKILDNYNHLKEELKNNENLLKTQITLFTNEEQKLINSNHLNSLKENKERNKKHIDFLLDLRTNLFSYKNNLNMENIYECTRNLFIKLDETVAKNYTDIVIYPSKNIDEYILKYNTILATVNSQLDNNYTFLEKKYQDKKQLDLNKELSITDQKQRIITIDQTVTKLINGLHFPFSIDVNLNNLKTDLYKLEVSLPELLRTVPENTIIDNKRKYTKEKYENLLILKNDTYKEITEVASKELTLTKQINEYKETNDNISCPKCDHNWSPKNIPELITKTKNELNVVLTNKIKLQEKLKQLETELNEIIEYISHYKTYSTLKNATYETFKLVWDIIDKNELFFNNPTSIIQYINKISLDIISIETIQKLTNDKKEISKNLELLEAYKDVSYNTLLKEIDDLEITIEDLQLYKDSILNTLQKIKNIKEVYSLILSIKTHLEESVIDLFSTNVSFTVSEILNSIESDLTKYKIIIIELEKELSKYENIQYTLDSYKKSMEEIKSNIKVLNIILDELSPKNGLIARSVSSFLNIIITSINKTIMSIWNYKMILKPINIESENLTYKFKVEVEDKLEIADTSLVSRGMKEIINLAFKLILYKLLGLQETPLFLDELGSNLDSSHSNSILNLVQQLSISDQYSQIFIITHKENFSFLKGIDLISLDS